jgi:ABC-type molybdate transport system substrate-binding protein
MMFRNPSHAPLRAAIVGLALTSLAAPGFAESPDSIQVFAAGSLRGVVGELAEEAGPILGIEVQSSFGGSGLMRERIEKGESPDLFLSADVGNPQKLRARTSLPVIAFARNRMCIVSRRSAGVTQTNLIDRLLARDVRIKTSTPIADPSGDYAWAIFDAIEAQRPGAGTKLKEKAQAAMNLTATPASATQSAGAALFASHQIDVSITYCSGAANLEREVPDLTSLVVPPELDPHPLYGLIVLSAKPQALKLALYLLSERGQAIVAHQGLVPLTQLETTHP